MSRVSDIALRLLGHTATLLSGDAAVIDRFVWLRKHLRNGPIRTLDAGCGSGSFAMYASLIMNEVVGVSFDRRNNEVAEHRAVILGLKRIHFKAGDLRSLHSMESLGVFDQIICCETIEHIKDDEKLLKDFSRLLSPGGALLLTSPFKGYRRMPGDSISEVEDGGHVRWGYTHDEMEGLLRGANLEVVSADYVSGLVTQCLVRLQRHISGVLHPTVGWALVFPLRILQLLDRPITDLLGYPYLCIAVVARKPALVDRSHIDNVAT